MKEDRPADQAEPSSTTQDVEAYTQKQSGKPFSNSNEEEISAYFNGAQRLLQVIEKCSEETQKEVLEKYRETWGLEKKKS